MESIKGRCFISVGMTGTGKSTLAKEVMSEWLKSGLKSYCFDINNEYSGYTGVYPEPDFEKFIKNVTLLKNTFIMVDEATIFLGKHSSNSNLRQAVIRKRWTGNFIMLNFHSFRKIPYELFDICDGIFIKKTNDKLSYVEKIENDKVTEAFAEVSISEDKYFTKFVDLRN